MNKKFHKTIETKHLFDTEFEHCIVVSNFCYTPENKTISVCFSNLLHHHDEQTSLQIAGKQQSFWCNITGEKWFEKLESKLYNDGINAAIETIFEKFKPQIELRFLSKK